MKKILCVLIAFAMVLSITPAIALADDEHSHCICGGENNVADHTTHTAVTWTGISDLSEITTGGYYYLKNNVTLSDIWCFEISDVNLCLNGKTITGAKDKAAVYIDAMNCSITDCNKTPGKITHKTGEKGTGVFINAGNLTFWNGRITGNSGAPGVVVSPGISFIMNGGSIDNNSDNNILSVGGGVLCVGSKFTMNGGSIMQNTAAYGGGVCVDEGGRAWINGGSITQNTATYGGGVYIFAATEAKINGGNITQNRATKDGGGVLSERYLSISGNVNISGNVKGGTITNGVLTGETPNNVYIPNGKTITVESGKTLAATAYVGITAENPANLPTVVTGTTSATGFFSDNEDYYIEPNGSDGLKLNKVHKHCICGGENNVGDHTTHTKVTWTGISDLGEITTGGYYYLKNDVTLSDTWYCKISDVNLCLNGKTITGAKDEIAVFIEAKNFSITDCNETPGKINYKTGGVFVHDNNMTLWNGKITGVSGNAAGVNLIPGASFIMNGGSITGNGDSGVTLATGNHFTMNGGSITGNGGSGVHLEFHSSFTMNGGSITGNGKYGVYINDDTTFFIMTGGSITGNTSTGVYGYGPIKLSGDVNITGNTGGNVDIRNGRNITVESGKPLAATAKVGITAENPASLPTVVTGTTSTTGFFSDNEDYDLEPNGSDGLKLKKLHRHCICGGENNVADHTTHTAVTWTGISDLSEITTGGYYYLKNDVTLSGEWACGISDVNLCLNGKTITGANSYSVIRVNTGASLVITDCRETVGKITHKVLDGRGVRNQGTLTLYNGSIEKNNSNSKNGGGVDNYGTFTMNGGSIRENLAISGGGVNNWGIFTMNGGSITDNDSDYNGGVANCGTFTMNGGNITGNNAVLDGVGGVHNYGTFTVSGNVNISGNVKGGTITNGLLQGGSVNNVYLPSGKNITVESGKTLAATAKVGITAENPASLPTVVTGTTSATGFFSDNEDYMLVSNGSDGLKMAEYAVNVSGVKLLNKAGGTGFTNFKYYDGEAVAYDASAVSYTPNISGVTFTYKWQNKNGSYTDINAAPKTAGNYRLLVSAVKNGKVIGTQSLEFEIEYYSVTGTEYSVNSNDWINEDFVVTAAENWQLSTTSAVNGNWVKSLKASNETSDGTLKFYLKNTVTGAITEEITEHYKIDKTAPVISGVEDGKSYCEAVTLTVTEKNLDKIAANGIPQILTDGKLTLPPEHFINSCKVVVKDKAGNSAQVTINYGHVWGDWVSNGNNTHTRVCKVNSEHTETADCQGGKATCKDKAVCEVCNESYGETDPNNHTDLKHIDAVEATILADGNKEYWHCDGCDKYYSDENATTEIKKENTIIAKPVPVNTRTAPVITAGDGATVTQGERKELSFTSNAAFSDFIRAEVDGVTLDEKNYTKKEGSTIITLKADYVAALSAGEHTLSIVSTNGTATAKFTVNQKAEDVTDEADDDIDEDDTDDTEDEELADSTKSDGTKSPLTGNYSTVVWAGFVFISIGIITIIMIKKKKRII